MHAPNVPIVLIGTKLDMREDPEVLRKLKEKNSQPITGDMGRAMQREIGAASYVECSAKSQKGLKDVFNEAIKVVFYPPSAKPETAEEEHKEKKDCCILL